MAHIIQAEDYLFVLFPYVNLGMNKRHGQYAVSAMLN